MTFDGRRVLVVEDEFLVSLTTTDLLESIGCEVVGPAARLAKAVQLAQSESLDAAVLDVDISGETIWPVVFELERRRVPFLFLSVFLPLIIFPARFASPPIVRPCYDTPAAMLWLTKATTQGRCKPT